MNITKIQNMPAGLYEPREIRHEELQKSKQNEVSNAEDSSKSKEMWKKDILLNALDKLEDNIQLDDSHPLGRKENQPIETFDEALIELAFLKESNFKEVAAQAQANLDPKDVLSLFVDNQAEENYNYYDII